MTVPSTRITGIACAIFRREIEALQSAGLLDFPFRYLSSMLHITPAGLEDQLQGLISAERRKGRPVLLVYGDCCAHMLDFEAGPGVARTSGINCCEIVLGREIYRRLRAEVAFFLMPEWALRWREIFEQELGLHGENARDFMTDMHAKMIYLDTGLMPVPQAVLAEMSDFAGLPCGVLPVTLEPLLANMRDACERIKYHA
ncbi:MAG: DUF1638 domain-containing protein [Deltaproteobacteria bacterium]|nr:DUF1638 domain-containing protein [Deltaproteobacteria bacterium]